jgi:pectate lyase
MKMKKRFLLFSAIMVSVIATLIAGCGGGGSSKSPSSSPSNKNQIVITPSYTVDTTASAIAVRYANSYKISGATLATATVSDSTTKLLAYDTGITATTSSDGITLANTTTGDLHFTIGYTGAAGCFNFTPLASVVGKIYAEFEVDIAGGGYIRAFNSGSTGEADMVMTQAYVTSSTTVNDSIKSLYTTAATNQVYFQVTLPKKATMKIYNIFLYMETKATGFAAISSRITGGAGSSGDCIYTVTNAAELKSALASAATDSGASIIKVNGEITFADWCVANNWKNVTPGSTKYTYSGYRMININSSHSDLTIVGVGTTGVFNGVGLKVTGNNIIVQNITMHEVLAQDGIQINNGTYVKVDHCELWNWPNAIETSPSEATKDQYDELISIKNNAQSIILAWNYLHGSYKTILVGSNDNADALPDRKLIMHHNYIRNCGSRLPLYRGGYAHIYNNYLVDVTGSGVNCRAGAHVKVEKNYFSNCKKPIGYFYDDSSSNTGYWDVNNNSYSGCSGNCPTASTCTVTFESSYSYTLDEAANVPAIVKAGAGVGK